MPESIDEVEDLDLLLDRRAADRRRLQPVAQGLIVEHHRRGCGGRRSVPVVNERMHGSSAVSIGAIRLQALEPRRSSVAERVRKARMVRMPASRMRSDQRVANQVASINAAVHDGRDVGTAAPRRRAAQRGEAGIPSRRVTSIAFRRWRSTTTNASTIQRNCQRATASTADSQTAARRSDSVSQHHAP